MMKPPSPTNVRFVIGLALLLLCNLSLGAMLTDAAQLRLQHDPNSYQKEVSHQMHQRVTKQLWKGRIHSIVETPNSNQQELRDLINQLNTVSSQPVQSTRAEQSPVTPTRDMDISIKTSTSVQASDMNETEVTSKTVITEPNDPDRDALLARVSQVQEANEWIENPLELADLLYRRGYLKQARLFYEQSVSRADPNQPENRAWSLFQLGHCYKHDDPLEARRYYRQVVQEYSDSPWAAIANVQLALVQMNIDLRPQELLRESREHTLDSPVAAIEP